MAQKVDSYTSRIRSILESIQTYLDQYEKQLEHEGTRVFKTDYISKSYQDRYELELLKINKEFGDNLKDSIHANIKYLSDEIVQCENFMLGSSASKIDRLHKEAQIDSLKVLLEDKMEYLDRKYKKNDSQTTYTQEGYNYYPEIVDPEFNKIIYSKQEFFKNKIPLLESLEQQKKKREKGFSLSSAQKFAKNFISEYTPYNGVLLWHEVGVGKTCAGISIAENFKEYLYANKKKILILTPSDTLQQNWRDEIFNIEKELNNIESENPKNVQCTGTEYSKLFKNITRDNIDSVKRSVKLHIDQYYEFLGYQKLARSIIKDLKNVLAGRRLFKQRLTIQYIKQRFSNRVIIMDEVHVTRDSDTSKDKLARPYIEMIARYAENTKLILLTATPMYNISQEIVWLMNLLLWNDKRAPIYVSDIFKSDGIELKDDDESQDDMKSLLRLNTGSNILIKKTKGYVSYVRGENPITFPIKLNPEGPNSYTPSPLYELKTGKKVSIPESETIKNMIFYKNSMSEWQYNHMKQYILNNQDSEEDEINESSAFSRNLHQSSNIVFPTGDMNMKGEKIGEIGDKGFKECFEYNKSDSTYSIKESVVDEENQKSFLHRSNIGKYSSKFKNIIDSCLDNKGIGFIFSQFIAAGIKSIALALEENGFTRYMGDDTDKNLLKNPTHKDLFCAKHLKYFSQLSSIEKKTFTPARYILLDGSVSKILLNKLIKECRGEGSHPNINGEHIKIVLGSKVLETGVSLARVREIHILEPWYHLNQMEQAAGRAIRNFSHMGLSDPKERNVTLFLHISALPETIVKSADKLETPDERVYRIGYFKRIHMAKIERLLKKNAIDCQLNKLGNLYLEKDYQDKEAPLSEREIIDSKGNKRVINLYDKDNSYNCNYSSCEYKCYSDDNKEKEFDEYKDNDTYNTFFAEDDIQLIIENIKELFHSENSFQESEIKEFINDLYPDIKEKYIYQALSKIIEEKIIIKDKFNRTGVIQDIDGVYVFQPSELEDKLIPLHYRELPNYKKIEDVFEENIPSHKGLKISVKGTKSSLEDKGDTKEIDKINDKLDKIYKAIKNNDKSIIGYDIDSLTRYTIHGQELFNISREYLEILVYIHMFETYFNIKDQVNLLKHVISKEIVGDKLSITENILLEYYNREKIIKIILTDKDFDEDLKESGNIAGFRYFLNGRTYIYKKNRENKLVLEDNINWPKLVLKLINIPVHKGVTGFIEEKITRTKSSSNKFIIINNLDTKEIFNQNKSKSKKIVRTGAPCGQAKGAKDIPQLYNIINKLIQQTSIFIEMDKVKKELLIKTLIECEKKDFESDKTNQKPKPNLCTEIEILLRYLDMHSPKVLDEHRFFYTYLERLLLNTK